MDYYECDLPLWFLGVLGKALTDGTVKPDAFGGPSTRTAQGNLVGQVSPALQGTPLAALVADAYDADLRNTVGHNA